MSRSRKKNPICGNAAYSESFDKKMWHRRWRKKEKERLDGEDFDSETVHYREISNVWAMHKEGKHRTPKESDYYPKAFRK